MGLKTGFFNTAQAWEEPPVSYGDPEPYEDGVAVIGTQWKTRKVINEMSFKDHGDTKGFLNRTKSNFLQKHP